MTINYSRNQDCFALTINAILSRVIEPVSLLWNQAGMLAFEDNNNTLFTPYFLETKDNLKRVANIDAIDENFNDFNSFSKSIMDILKNGYTVMICVDVFNLPFNLYYQKKHSNHYIEVVGIDNEGFFICDHFYKYTGIVSSQIIYKAMTSLIEEGFKTQYSFTYYDTSRLQIKDGKGFLEEMLHVNTSVILGQEPFKLREINNKKRIIGLTALDNFIQYLDNEIFIKQENFQQIYRNLFSLSNSRYHYANIIKALEGEKYGLHGIIEGYEDISQLAKISANIILKISVTKNVEPNQLPVLSKLNTIRTLEEKLVENVKKEWFFSVL
jgi:Butirosin biosynthesis protein H, N-terminal